MRTIQPPTIRQPDKDARPAIRLATILGMLATAALLGVVSATAGLGAVGWITGLVTGSAEIGRASCRERVCMLV